MRTVFLFIIGLMLSSAVAAQDFQYPYAALQDRDPLRPLVSNSGEFLIREKKDAGNFILQGIVYSPEGSRAVLNNELYAEGETVGGYLIKKITGNEVFLEKDNKEYILKWEE